MTAGAPASMAGQHIWLWVGASQHGSKHCHTHPKQPAKLAGGALRNSSASARSVKKVQGVCELIRNEAACVCRETRVTHALYKAEAICKRRLTVRLPVPHLEGRGSVRT